MAVIKRIYEGGDVLALRSDWIAGVLQSMVLGVVR